MTATPVWCALFFGCHRCEPDGPPPDYAAAESWICRPGDPDDPCDEPIRTLRWGSDGTVTGEVVDVASDPPADCFWVYPTVDLHLRRGLHEDLSDLESEREVVHVQASWLATSCAVYAPAYRQVTLGTYMGPERNAECFDVAFSDVLDAFEVFVASVPTSRPFVVAGHSQGAQIASRLVRERIETDAALLERLVAAYPIGWPVGTDTDSLLGGSFEQVPLCASADEVGCAVTFRSYASGAEPPRSADAIREGDVVACTNPASPGTAGPVRLAAATFPGDSRIVELPDDTPIDPDCLFVVPDAYVAECTTGDDGHGALAITWDPPDGDARTNLVDFDARRWTGKSGLHILDLQLTVADLATDIATRTAAWQARDAP